MSDQQQKAPSAGTQEAGSNGDLPPIGRLFSALAAPKAAKTLFYALVVLCAGSFLADFLYHKHTYVSVENIPGFYALYGLFMTAGTVVLAKIWGRWVRRDQDYYAPYDVDAETYPQDNLSEERHNG